MNKKYTTTFILIVVMAIPLLVGAAEDIKIIDPLGLATNDSPAADVPFVLYGRLINGFTAIMGAIALFFFIIGGFRWLTSGGNEEKVRKGRDTLIWATLGLAVILSSYVILSYVIATVSGAV